MTYTRYFTSSIILHHVTIRDRFSSFHRSNEMFLKKECPPITENQTFFLEGALVFAKLPTHSKPFCENALNLLILYYIRNSGGKSGRYYSDYGTFTIAKNEKR